MEKESVLFDVYMCAYTCLDWVTARSTRRIITATSLKSDRSRAHTRTYTKNPLTDPSCSILSVSCVYVRQIFSACTKPHAATPHIRARVQHPHTYTHTHTHTHTHTRPHTHTQMCVVCCVLCCTVVCCVV